MRGGWRGARRTPAAVFAWLLVIALAAPALAFAADAAPPMDAAQGLDAVNQLKALFDPNNKSSGLAPFYAPPGTFDPAGPTPEAVASAITMDRIQKQGYPEYFQVTEVFVVTRAAQTSDASMYWAVRYRTNLRLGLISDVCFLELVTFDPQNKIPLGVGGMFFVDPVFTMQSMAAGMTGAGKTPADLKAWLDSQPPPPGGVATAGFVSAFVVGLMGLANSLGGVPPVGSGRTTGRAIPAPLKEYMGQDWHWVYRNGKWVLVQGTFDAAGAWSTWGTPIAGSIFEVPDPSVFGDKINRFTTPVTGLDPQATAAKAVLADVMTTGLKDDLKPDRWATLSDAQRAEALAKVIRRLGPLTGVKGTSFAIRYGTTSNAGLEGEWSGRSRTLFINSRSRVVGDPRKMLSTALHELRHAGQEDYAADLGGGAEYRAKVTANDKTYAGSADYTRYAAQLSERDAEVFGETISKAVMDEVMKP